MDYKSLGILAKKMHQQQLHMWAWHPQEKRDPGKESARYFVRNNVAPGLYFFFYRCLIFLLGIPILDKSR